ncbi:DUF5673 domain-containing protein [Alkaliphilus hydrothermalis]|uniref:DUF5673 domain-containing protein n=1 Tax=Alkaliphilus hydrothermalis TaxID=1482730 RepID=A0ABS2NMY6_9FIRM|nr:DUF5673 domain-containing protein [Alkaliphilus hydrothermalis]MBM7614310.1 hypothetical protein [Alkaliphilus hydrothermalis]
MINLLIFIFILICSLIYNWINYRKLRGTLTSTRLSILPLALGCIILSTASFKHFYNIQGIIILPLELILGALLIYRGFNKLIVGENGVYIEGVFFHWDEIKNFHWDFENNKKLILLVKVRKLYLIGRKKISYNVSEKDVYKINSVLKEHVN